MIWWVKMHVFNVLGKFTHKKMSPLLATCCFCSISLKQGYLFLAFPLLASSRSSSILVNMSWSSWTNCFCSPSDLPLYRFSLTGFCRRAACLIDRKLPNPGTIRLRTALRRPPTTHCTVEENIFFSHHRFGFSFARCCPWWSACDQQRYDAIQITRSCFKTYSVSAASSVGIFSFDVYPLVN